MGNNTITDFSGEAVAQVTHHSQYRTALIGNHYPRNATTGVVEDEVADLGDASYKWRRAYLKELYLNGELFDPNADSQTKFGITSGAKTAYSDQPLFLDPNGASNAVTLLAATTNLVLKINSVSVTFSTDVTLSSLTFAPSSNNTCLVNDSNLTSQDGTKYIKHIPIDTVGSEITALNGKVAAFKISTEVFLAHVDTTNSRLVVLQRGGFWDSTQARIARVTIADNATITLLKAAWIFAENTGTSLVATYTCPIYAGTAPTSPATGDYWFDNVNEAWKIYTGSAWQAVDRHLIGIAITDTSATIATKSFDFNKTFQDINTIKIKKFSNSQIISEKPTNLISVYGNLLRFSTRIVWDMASNIEALDSEASSTRYHFYITEDGDPKISRLNPSYFPERLGLYHPYETWLWCGSATNDGSSNLGEVNIDDQIGGDQLITSSQVYFKPEGLQRIKVTITGGGGGGYRGGSGGANTDGGTSSFGSFCSASGGTKAPSSGNDTPAGGIGSSGDINIRGGAGNYGYSVTADKEITGGSSFWGGGGNDSTTGAYGSGGAACNLSSNSSICSGAAGGTAIKSIDLDDQSYVYVTIGTGGIDDSPSPATNGVDGVCLIENLL